MKRIFYIMLIIVLITISACQDKELLSAVLNVQKPYNTITDIIPVDENTLEIHFAFCIENDANVLDTDNFALSWIPESSGNKYPACEEDTACSKRLDCWLDCIKCTDSPDSDDCSKCASCLGVTEEQTCDSCNVYNACRDCEVNKISVSSSNIEESNKIITISTYFPIYIDNKYSIIVDNLTPYSDEEGAIFIMPDGGMRRCFKVLEFSYGTLTEEECGCRFIGPCDS